MSPYVHSFRYCLDTHNTLDEVCSDLYKKERNFKCVKKVVSTCFMSSVCLSVNVRN